MSYIKFYIDDLTPEIVKIAERELGETEEIKKQSLAHLKRLIKDEPDFIPRMDDRFLLRFLRIRKFNVEKAFKSLQKYYIFKAHYSGIFDDFKVSSIKDILDEGQFTILENRDQNYVGIGLIRNGTCDIEKFSIEEFLAYMYVSSEIGMQVEATQILGYSIIIDFTGFNLRMAKSWASPVLLYKIITAIKDFIPCRIKAYHIVNEPFYFDLLLSIIQPFLTEKFKSRIFVHGKNLNSLHKHVTADILPNELGGKEGPLADCVKNFRERILKTEDHFSKISKYGYQNKILQGLKK